MLPALRPVTAALQRAFRSRPLVFFLAAWVLGILTADRWALAPAVAGPAGIGLVGLCLLARHRWAALALLLLGVVLLGLTATRLAWQPPEGDISGWAGRQVTVLGVVEEVPRQRCRYWRAVVRVESLALAREAVPARGRLLVRTAKGLVNRQIRPGDRLRITGVLSRPSPARNPGGFSRELWLARQRIFAILSVSPNSVVLLPGGKWSLSRWAAQVRHRIADSNRRIMRDERAAALVNSLLFGDLDQDDAQQWSETEEQFRRAGLSHVLVVSGAQVALLFGLLFVWRRWALRPHPTLPARFARQVRRLGGYSQRQALFWGLLLLLPYLILTGLEACVFRAALMAGILYAARCLDRESDPENSLAAAALLLLVINPLSLYDLGGQLSFAAVWGILRLAGPLSKVLGVDQETAGEVGSGREPAWSFAGPAWVAPITVSLAAQLATTPLIAQHFQQVSLMGLPANPPVCLLAALLLPLGLASSVIGTLLLSLGCPQSLVAQLHSWWPTEWVARLINVTVDQLAKPEGAAVPVFPPGWGIVAAYTVLLLIAAMPVWDRLRWARLLPVGAAVALLAIGSQAPAFPVRAPTLTFVDVGQGDACLIRLPSGTTMLVDGGGSPRAPCWQEDCEGVTEGTLADGLRMDCLDVGRDILAEFLRHERVRRIDLLVLSHPHDDHLWGLNALLTPGERFEIGTVLDSGFPEDGRAFREWQALLQHRKVTRITARRGMRLQLGPARLAVLHPPARPMAGTRSDANNNSIVLRLEVEGTRVLLPGDVEAPAEARLGDQDVSADLLKVAHHGSATSTSGEWLDRVRPRIAVISCGPRNPFGHPSPVVLRELEQRGIRIFRTDLHGAVTLELRARRWTAWTTLVSADRTEG